MVGKKNKINKNRTELDQKSFLRDGRSPIPKKIITSNVMSANKAKDTQPELLFRKALWAGGIKGYRLHWKKVPGRPDFAFPKNKIAIFVNGCFWHRCPNCDLAIPKSNSMFWLEKFNKNTERDFEKIKLLKEANWKVMVVWECELNVDINKCVKKAKALIGLVN